MSVQNRPHVVIVGAGFGGLYAARALADDGDAGPTSEWRLL